MEASEKIRRKIYNAIGKVVNKIAQNESANGEDYEKTVTDGMPGLLRKAGAEGTVLLRNDGVLPLDKDREIAVFGRVQLDWFYVGYGSGGDVIKPYTVNLIDGLKNDGARLNEPLLRTYREWCEKNPPDHGFWGHWPRCYEEMPVADSAIKAAAVTSECAVIVIGRSAGEDRENELAEGSYLLTKDEKSLIARVAAEFRKLVIILNVGSVIDMAWEDEIPLCDTAILLPFQGGMESGNAAADVLLGISEPSGRLTDTAAKKYELYPSAADFGKADYNNFTEDIYVGYRYFETFDKGAVKYPFGCGLSYTKFSRKGELTGVTDTEITVSAAVKNTGERGGKDVLELYAAAPQGVLGKPARVLCAFRKTELLASDESAVYELTFPVSMLASYDDSGVTGHKSCYVLEAGEYELFLGGDVRNAEKIGSFTVSETRVAEQLKEVSAPKNTFNRLINKNGERAYENAPVSTENLKEIILENLPEIAENGNKNLTLDDVKSGRCTLKEFVAELTPDELEAISRGDYTMDSSLGAKGNAGALGGVLESLRNKGVSPLITTDGPSGIRLKSCCSLLPVGTALAAMWNTELAYEIYAKIGCEMKEKGSDILLAPGMNIHRNPLCGRNFEYFSEDPLITGKTAAAIVKGIQSAGVSACPKHFACNSQETNRTKTDSRVSERALREIYLKGFEICVKEAKPLCLMTSYNKVNGVWSHYNYDLCTRILRDEWGFEGLVMTDWWMQYTASPEFPSLKDNAYRVRAGVDVLMPGGKRSGRRKPDGTLLKTYGKPDGITLGEMQRTAEHVLGVVMKIK